MRNPVSFAVAAQLWVLALAACGQDGATEGAAETAGSSGGGTSAAAAGADAGGAGAAGSAGASGMAGRGGSAAAAGSGGRAGAGAAGGTRADAGRGAGAAGAAGAAGRAAAGRGGAGAAAAAGRGGAGAAAAGRGAGAGGGGTAGSAGAAGAAGTGGAPSALETACSPRVAVDNADPSGAGAGFARALPDPQTAVVDITRALCRILYRSPDEPRLPSSITVRVYDFDGAANAGGMTINISTRHLANYSGAALAEEITGVLFHEATHLYQYNDGPGGLIEGIADFVRIEAGHHSPNRRRAGGNWDDGYTTTGFFLSWLDDQYPDFGYELNLTLARDDNRSWSEQVFVELTGKDVDTLWNEYQATL